MRLILTLWCGASGGPPDAPGPVGMILWAGGRRVRIEGCTAGTTDTGQGTGSLALASLAEHAIMTQTGHRSAAVLRRYIRNADPYRDNTADLLGSSSL